VDLSRISNECDAILSGDIYVTVLPAGTIARDSTLTQEIVLHLLCQRRTNLTSIQNLLIAVFPKAWAEDMRAESLSWMMRCTCGFERSIWES